jgi:hypothetical protein
MALGLQGGSCRTWVDVVGGPRRQRGEAAPGRVTVYTGATSTSEAQYAVHRGGHLVVRSVYHEVSGKSPQGILLNDSGTLSIDATRCSYNTTAERPLIKIDGYQGMFTLLTELLLPVDSQHTARVEITGSGHGTRVLCMDNLFWENGAGVTADAVWQDRSAPPAQSAMLLCNQNLAHGGANQRGGFDTLEDRGAASDAFIRRMLEPLRRARIRLPEVPRAGTTGVQLHRVICSAGKEGVGVELRAGAITTGVEPAADGKGTHEPIKARRG